jgi:hypothetical protein
LLNFSDTKVPLLSETSDYGSGTDPEQQSIQHTSPQIDSPPFTFDVAERSFSYTNTDDYCTSQIRRASSSSSSSSSSTSPSSSNSNLSYSSSSSEVQTKVNNQNRLSTKKLLSINSNNNNNNNTSTDTVLCYCEKENLSNRKRNRLNGHSLRRLSTINYCENCQAKRAKQNLRSKYSSNRQQRKQRVNNRYYDPLTSTPVKFTVDLTGLNVDYTIEYHHNKKCTSPTTLLPCYNSFCKCSSMNDWSSFVMMNSLNDHTNEFYYIDKYNNSWIQQTIPTLINYYDLYLTKMNADNISTIYFDDHSINNDTNESIPSYHLRYITPAIERECEE